MTYSPIQLDIIRTFGSKELSKWLLFHPNSDDFQCIYEYVDEDNHINTSYKNDIVTIFESDYDLCWWKIWTVLWHIPELFPCIARVAKEKGYPILTNSWIIKFQLSNTEFVRIPYESTLPLINQSEETLTQLLNLFK